MLLKVWINVYYGFGAAVVVFLALCYESDQHSRSAEEKRSAVREMADICSTASHLSAGAKKCVSELQRAAHHRLTHLLSKALAICCAASSMPSWSCAARRGQRQRASASAVQRAQRMWDRSSDS
jgi:hypothetical protein